MNFESDEEEFAFKKSEMRKEVEDHRFHTLLFPPKSQNSFSSSFLEAPTSPGLFTPSSDDEIVKISPHFERNLDKHLSMGEESPKKSHKRSKTVRRPIVIAEAQQQDLFSSGKKSPIGFQNQNSSFSSSLSSSNTSLPPLNLFPPRFFSNPQDEVLKNPPKFNSKISDSEFSSIPLKNATIGKERRSEIKQQQHIETSESFFLPHGITDEEENGGVSSSVDLISDSEEENSELEIPVSSLSDSEVAFGSGLWRNKLNSFFAPLSSWSFAKSEQNNLKRNLSLSSNDAEASNSFDIPQRHLSRSEGVDNSRVEKSPNLTFSPPLPHSKLTSSSSLSSFPFSSSFSSNLSPSDSIHSPSKPTSLSASTSPTNFRITKEGKGSSMSANSPTFVSSRSSFSPPFPFPMPNSSLPNANSNPRANKFSSGVFYPSGSVSDEGEGLRSSHSSDFNNPFPNWNANPTSPTNLRGKMENSLQNLKNAKPQSSSEYVVSKPTALRQHRTERKTWKVKVKQPSSNASPEDSQNSSPNSLNLGSPKSSLDSSSNSVQDSEKKEAKSIENDSDSSKLEQKIVETHSNSSLVSSSSSMVVPPQLINSSAMEDFKLRTSLDKMRDEKREESRRRGHARVPTKSEEEIGQAAANLLAEIAKSTQVDLFSTPLPIETPVSPLISPSNLLSVSISSPENSISVPVSTETSIVLPSQLISKEKKERKELKKEKKKKEVKETKNISSNLVPISNNIVINDAEIAKESEKNANSSVENAKKKEEAKVKKEEDQKETRGVRTHHRTRSYSEGDQFVNTFMRSSKEEVKEVKKSVKKEEKPEKESEKKSESSPNSFPNEQKEERALEEETNILNRTLSVLFMVQVSLPQWTLLYFGFLTLFYVFVASPFIISLTSDGGANRVATQSMVAKFLSWLPAICTYFVLVWIHVKCAMYIFPHNPPHNSHLLSNQSRSFFHGSSHSEIKLKDSEGRNGGRKRISK